ncbi:hypothetical protein BHE74_00058116 [Ensete ventricosum]|nr:hypothetical protein BHE74_00058116 [Ensete ventricosum]RZS23997.1 hypothetical protein BHM03_00057011 [Ensete ventricosum]
MARPPIWVAGHDLAIYKGAVGCGQGPLQRGDWLRPRLPAQGAADCGQPAGAICACGHDPASGLQVQTCSQTTGAAHEEHGSEHDEREVRYSPLVEEAQSGAPTGKRSHNERFSIVETRLDVLEASLEELYQGQGRLLGVESSQEEAESRIDRVESLVNRLTEDTKDSV